jgi:hypothetical protein
MSDGRGFNFPAAGDDGRVDTLEPSAIFSGVADCRSHDRSRVKRKTMDAETEYVLVARWESARGRDWAELRKYGGGFWAESEGFHGFAGFNEPEAIRFMESKTAAGAYFFCRQRSAMTRVL